MLCACLEGRQNSHVVLWVRALFLPPLCWHGDYVIILAKSSVRVICAHVGCFTKYDYFKNAVNASTFLWEGETFFSSLFSNISDHFKETKFLPKEMDT